MAGLRGVLATVLDVVAKTGKFEAVVDHEPLSAPTESLTAAVFIADPFAPISESSGLAAADARLVIMVRIMRRALTEPLGDVDLDALDAADAVMDALAGGFTLGNTARAVDVLGESGQGLQVLPGYATIDKTIFRLMDIIVPVMINNVWTYGA
jgi:hypothetical protein